MINVRKIVSRTRIAIESNKKSLWVICEEYVVHLPLWLNTLIHLRLWRTCSRCLHNVQWYSSCLRPRRESDCRQEAMHCGCTYLLIIRLASLHDTTRYLTCMYYIEPLHLHGAMRLETSSFSKQILQIWIFSRDDAYRSFVMNTEKIEYRSW